ncbi:hypothetical protein Tco_0680975 [Tanacetum coccineum]|uniref:Uncharacterized protein n=1 Tax=Tanacetum coccineum TaxID=301880 RepID=A0ABQ4XMY7_9ASTR
MLRYQVDGYDEGIIHSYEQRLKTIWSRPVNRVHVLDFEGLTPEMRRDLACFSALHKWKLYECCGVHTLFMDGTPMEINMLVEKKYPLIKELLEKMLNLQLEAEEESTMAFELIKFIKSMLEE